MEQHNTTIRFDERVAVVTGAGRGIGRAYAKALAKRGAKVVVADVGAALEGDGADPTVAATVVREIEADGGAAVAATDSIATLEGGRRIIDTAMDTYGRVDIVINNAGVLRDRSFLKMSESEWDDVMAVHLKGAFTVSQPALGIMKQRGYGRIVFTSSTSGLFGNFGQTNYGSAKMGVVGLMNSLKIEIAKYDIGINAIAPTAATRMTEQMFQGEMKDRMAPEYNVPLVLYLVSKENRDTGMIFCSKGGWYARTAIVCGDGIAFAPEEGIPSPEAIMDRFEAIKNLDNAKPLTCGADTMKYLK